MRVSYDQETDALMVVVRENTPIARTAEVEHGLIDLDATGEVVAFELLGASAVIERAAELLHSQDLARDLADVVRAYIQQAQAQIEAAESSRGDVRA